MNVLLLSPGYPADMPELTDALQMADAVGSELHLYAE